MKTFSQTVRGRWIVPIGTAWISAAGLLDAAPTLPGPSQATVDAAIAAPLIRYNRNLPGGAHTDGAWHGGASVTLAVAAFTGNTLADARLLQQIRYTITGGNDISANGGYPAQHERHVTAMFAIAKQTPRIWDQLTAAEKTRIDLLMKAAFVASAFTTSDNNPYVKAGTAQYTLDGDGNVHRDWNPNYREGMIGGVLVGMVYFDGPAAADAILNSYNHAQFVGELAANGLTGAHQTFNWKAANPASSAPTGTMIENGVRNYRYYGNPLSNYLEIYNRLLSDTYGATVNCGLNDGAGINGAGRIVSGCETLPNKGVNGMLKEFDGMDGGGPRSSAIYAYDGFRPHQANQLTLIIGGYWPTGTAVASNAAARIKVGATDLWYKIERGYIDYAKGAPGWTFDLSYSANWGFAYNRGLWEEVLRPFHESGGEPTPPFAVGARIQTIRNTNVRAIGSLSGTLLGTQPTGALGRITSGPVPADGIQWWFVDYDDGVDGWSGQPTLATLRRPAPPRNLRLANP